MKLRNLTVIAAALAFAAPATALVPSHMYVFGDSFIDSGNVWLATGGLIPNAAQGYFQGRFSNGPNWADILSQHTYGVYSTPYLGGGDNYAVGGARAAQDDPQALGTIPGLPSQLGLYTAQHGFLADPDALYIINFGNNDVNAIQSGDTHGLSTSEYIAAYVGNMVGSVVGLSAAGAKNILLLGVPNPTEAEGVALQGLLDAQLDLVQPGLSANLYRYDYFSFFTRLQADPTAFGLPYNLDFNTPCIAVRPVIGGQIDCTGFLSFDGIHVTDAVHLALAREIATLVGLNAVPEPATWTLMIAGFGMVGGAMRRSTARQRVTLAAAA